MWFDCFNHPNEFLPVWVRLSIELQGTVVARLQKIVGTRKQTLKQRRKTGGAPTLGRSTDEEERRAPGSTDTHFLAPTNGRGARVPGNHQSRAGNEAGGCCTGASDEIVNVDEGPGFSPFPRLRFLLGGTLHALTHPLFPFPPPRSLTPPLCVCTMKSQMATSLPTLRGGRASQPGVALRDHKASATTPPVPPPTNLSCASSCQIIVPPSTGALCSEQKQPLLTCMITTVAPCPLPPHTRWAVPHLRSPASTPLLEFKSRAC